MLFNLVFANIIFHPLFSFPNHRHIPFNFCSFCTKTDPTSMSIVTQINEAKSENETHPVTVKANINLQYLK